MCGIAGLIDLKHRRSVPLATLKRSADAIVHRGPDEEGFLRRDGVGFASRRLSIVGLADGQQPCFNEDKSVAVVFNGEIFDHGVHREDLEKRGHRFKTHCDTEVLPHLWEEHREGMFERLNGQFAFALFDEPGQKIILARDRFGICPLFWTRQTRLGSDWLIFASEIKAILATGLVEAKPDRRGIDSVFNFLAVPGPYSCFEGINCLLPGKFLTIDRGRSGADAQISEKTYFTFDFPDQGQELRGQNENQLIDEFESILYSAVDRRLKADVPVVSYLSGGVDSSTVVAMATDVLGRPPPTFTIKILDKKLDETAQAEVVSDYLGAKPHIVECGSKDIVAQYQKLLVATEAPVTDTSCTALMMLAERVHDEGYKVALTGEGADEWLAGYSWFKFARGLEAMRNVSGGRLDKLANKLFFTRLGYSAEAFRYSDKCDNSAGGRHAFQGFYDILSISRFHFYSDEMFERLAGHDPFAIMEPDLERARRWHPLNRAVYWGARIHLPGQLLSLKGDRVAMNHSVETRYPFLDNAVFDFLAKIDPEWKLKGYQDKYLLRRVAERWLPKQVAWQPKGMFRAPFDGFFSEHQMPYVNQLLSEASIKKTGYFDHAAIAKWRKEAGDLSTVLYKRSSVELGLVAVIATQLWHHTFIDPTLADLPDWRQLAGLPPCDAAQALSEFSLELETI